MIKFRTLLSERYINLFNDDIKVYIDEIWDILQRSYAPIGGFLTASTKEELIQKSWMAKCVKKNGKIVAVRLYKDQHGRKGIAGGTDGSAIGKQWFMKMIQEDIKFGRSWSEVSGAMEHILRKSGAEPIPNYLAKSLTGKDILELNPDGYHYTRLIGGEPHEKIIFGTVNK
jgi:hypothetical protein